MSDERRSADFRRSLDKCSTRCATLRVGRRIDFPKGDHRRPTDPFLFVVFCDMLNMPPPFSNHICTLRLLEVTVELVEVTFGIWGGHLGLLEVTFGILGGIWAQFGSQKLLFGSKSHLLLQKTLLDPKSHF